MTKTEKADFLSSEGFLTPAGAQGDKILDVVHLSEVWLWCQNKSQTIDGNDANVNHYL